MIGDSLQVIVYRGKFSHLSPITYNLLPLLGLKAII